MKPLDKLVSIWVSVLGGMLAATIFKKMCSVIAGRGSR
jgi:hypothetical protein